MPEIEKQELKKKSQQTQTPNNRGKTPKQLIAVKKTKHILYCKVKWVFFEYLQQSSSQAASYKLQG